MGRRKIRMLTFIGLIPEYCFDIFQTNKHGEGAIHVAAGLSPIKCVFVRKLQS